MIKYMGFEIYKNEEGLEGVLYCRDKEKKDWYEIVKKTKINTDDIGLLIYKNEIVDISKDLSVFFPANKFDVIVCKKEEWMKRSIKISFLDDKIKILEDTNE